MNRARPLASRLTEPREQRCKPFDFHQNERKARGSRRWSGISIRPASQAPNFTFGNTSRTSPDLRTPSQNNLDASVFKNFRMTERSTMQFRAEAFNATNHPTWGNPGIDVTNVGSFGVITSKSGSRVMQLALKLLF